MRSSREEVYISAVSCICVTRSFEFSGERGSRRDEAPPIGISAFASESWENHRYRHNPDHTPRWVALGEMELAADC